MSEDLIEKVAKALWDDKFEGYGKPWMIQGNLVQEDYRGHARAALAAIEESGTHRVVPIADTPDDIAWDKQIEEDAKSGLLDQMASEALEDHKAGRTRRIRETKP